MEREITVRMITADLPECINGMCHMDAPGRYIVVIDSKGTPQQQAAAFLHECLHIWHNDTATTLPADQIEQMRHREIIDLLQLLAAT